MIFSLLNLRKKTAATVAGIAIALLCLWGLSLWQDISIGELFGMLLGTLVMLLVIVVCALLLIAAFKLSARLLRRLLGQHADGDRDNDHPH